MIPVPTSDRIRLMKKSHRARLISEIVGNPEDYRSNEFASYFRGAVKECEPTCVLTSHVKSNQIQPNRKKNIHTYPSLIQNLRWSPYVEMSSTNDSNTDIIDNKRTFECKCNSCNEMKCPFKASLPDTKHGVFKDNIMTFSDQYTMTPRLNDVCCSVCLPGLSTPQSSKVCVAARGIESDEYNPKSVSKNCAPIPILKKTNRQPQVLSHGHCGYATGHIPSKIRQEAVRDTDMAAEDDYCEPIKQKSFKSFFKLKKKPVIENNNPVNEGVRKIIYNEGISDEVANFVPPVGIPPPINVERGISKIAIRNERDDGIPYSHNTESRYHHNCKKPNLNMNYYTADFEDERIDSPIIGRKFVVSKLPMSQYKVQRISLPRKVLTSEMDIDSYVERNRPAPPPPPKCRRKRSKMLF
ncbi:unnamed protein product [Chilo suppressalis]|uniref:Uncharacterized protein n=1 Tax=Chilo suppressalis TaxID=168631 RepID=A0ABN8BE63_CHISP|nr:unnamed protein product [Chilo suppressalis]